MTALDWIRYIFGAAFILFVPGFAWSWAFFKRDKVDWIERIALSVGLSIALVPLTVLWLHFLFNMSISLLNTTISVCVISLAPLIYIYARNYRLKKRGALPKSQSITDDEDISNVDPGLNDSKEE